MEELLAAEVLENAGFEGCGTRGPGASGKFCW